jgi:hypothetical protein
VASSNFDIGTLSNLGTFRLTGQQASTYSIGTVDIDSGLTQYYGTGGTVFSSTLGPTGAGSYNYYNLEIAGSGTFTLNGNVSLVNNLTITAGILDVSASDYSVTLAGNWRNDVG